MTALPRLILITDDTLRGERLYARLEGPLSLGEQVGVQLRGKRAATQPLLKEARALKALCERAGNPLFINGRLDLALLLNVNVHLGADDVLPSDARRLLPTTSWVSVAVHNEAEARRAAGADLALISPVFSPRSKPGDLRPVLGAEGFLELEGALPCPAFALGGIDRHTAARARAVGFAVVSAVLQANDPRAEAEALLSLVRRV